MNTKPALLLLSILSMILPHGIYSQVITGSGLITVSTSLNPPSAGSQGFMSSNPLPGGETGSGYTGTWDSAPPNSNRMDVGQIFMANSSYILGGITMLADNPITVSTQFTMIIETIEKGTGSNWVPTMTREPIAILSSNTLPVTSEGKTYLTFDLSAAGVQIEEGSLYGFRISFDAPAENQSLRWTYLGSSLAPEFADSPMYRIPYDMETGNIPQSPIRINGIGVYYITAIPEPEVTGISLLLACGLLAVFRRRNRSRHL